ERALEWWSRVDTEATLFWRGIVSRRSQPGAGDSLLRLVAGRPGYSFYRTSARETLGVRGWPARAAVLGAEARLRGLGLAGALSGRGREDAAFVLDRGAAGDARLVSRPPDARDWLALAAVAYAGDRPRQAIRLAQHAASDLADSAADLAWGASIWLYPPAYDS